MSKSVCVRCGFASERTLAPSKGLMAATKAGTKVTKENSAAYLNMAECKLER